MFKVNVNVNDIMLVVELGSFTDQSLNYIMKHSNSCSLQIVI